MINPASIIADREVGCSLGTSLGSGRVIFGRIGNRGFGLRICFANRLSKYELDIVSPPAFEISVGLELTDSFSLVGCAADPCGSLVVTGGSS